MAQFNNEHLRELLEAGHKDILRNTARGEKLLADKYLELYKVTRQKALDLWEKIGDPPTLQEARKYNRLAALMDEIRLEYAKVTRSATSVIASNSKYAFTESAYRAQYAIDKAAGVLIKYPVLPVGAIRAAVYNADNGLIFSKRLINNKAASLLKVQGALTQALVLGESTTKAARRIKDQFQSGYADAVRVLRTEATRASTSGTLQGFKDAQDAGVDMRTVWIAALDDRTRDSHRDLDGQYADKNGLFHWGGMTAEGPGLWGDPAMDINCRCALGAVIEGLEPELRREGRAGDDGGEIIDNMTYREWEAR
jgi:SPP1 gp7 family putative phage head morphogenesis protein